MVTKVRADARSMATKKPSKLNDPDLAEFLPNKLKARPCKVARLLAELSEDDLRKVEKAMACPDIRDAPIAHFFDSRTLPVSDHSVHTHRKGLCTCSK